MLNRRHLRVKVLQALYAFFQSGNSDLSAGEKELFFGIDKTYDLYLYQLSLLGELQHQEQRIVEENRNKHLPVASDLNPSLHFAQNRLLQMVAEHKQLKELCKRNKIYWNEHQDLVKKLLLHIKQQHYYIEYQQLPQTDFEIDRDFVVKMIKKDLLNFELLHAFYEEKSIYWLNDWELVGIMLMKSIKTVANEPQTPFALLELFKEETDKAFARDLFLRTILKSGEWDEIIGANTKNWDLERIALMDVIIMKMALTEIMGFQQIPVKVSLNEYIELSKMYSTPKSQVFVNGVLNKMVEELDASSKIHKFAK
ncbi:MAG TPA: transcription antitermination factor NusB [Bacteroidales bacterium]|nr:transcription antitermination factor NusB [Bacteroidales bacterium]